MDGMGATTAAFGVAVARVEAGEEGR